MSRPRVKLPKKAAAGEIITIKTLVNHKMESGQRKDKEGNTIPRLIINSFQCNFNGTPVFSCEIEPAVSANPFMEFTAKVPESGEFEFIWKDDNGDVLSTKKKITVA
ncbi:MAG: thiosulfate oxidation carrier complex protein SoxZ [Alphaproteobacteria bacterium]|nr:thiosulfate oxidation carrier complex protein SoxZ [Alphaproteobacteria bacterium]